MWWSNKAKHLVTRWLPLLFKCFFTNFRAGRKAMYYSHVWGDKHHVPRYLRGFETRFHKKNGKAVFHNQSAIFHHNSKICQKQLLNSAIASRTTPAVMTSQTMQLQPSNSPSMAPVRQPPSLPEKAPMTAPMTTNPKIIHMVYKISVKQRNQSV